MGWQKALQERQELVLATSSKKGEPYVKKYALTINIKEVFDLDKQKKVYG